ncbi:hypothetical protein [Haloechinothrix halophila]|uniref:hypothetical protein n=1 Tax=Haloechinothrix halophila TaxID=1069073 RepID=UPI0012F9F0AC|nr:hypothetical protein [Haloechinothrix halophila]
MPIDGHVHLGRAARVGEQRGVVHLGGRGSVNAEAFGEAHRDECRLQAVFEGEAHSEIGCQAEQYEVDASLLTSPDGKR